jgi:hypothetical protein
MDEIIKSGYPELIQSYINAITNLVSVERAKYAADASEQAIMQELGNLDRNNGLYVTSRDITPEIGEKVIKESVNAHLTKIQSEQIIQAASEEVARLEYEIKKVFVGKRVTVIVNSHNLDVVDQIMLDKHSNQYRVSKYTARKIKGTIENISFKDNLLSIKPTFKARMIVPNRILVNVYVLDIQNMTPNISIT